MKVLFIKFRALGDTVLLTAPLDVFKKNYPKAEIHVAVYSDWAPLLESHPSITKLWAYQRPKLMTSHSLQLAKLALKLRKENFDSVLNFHASPSSALFAFSIGSKHRAIHFHGHGDKNYFSTVPVPDKGILKSIIERDMDTLRAFKLKIPVGSMHRLILNEKEIQNAAQKIKNHKLAFPLLALGLGASRETKSWLMDRFAMTAVEWVQKTKGGIIAFFSHTESARAHQFMKELDAISANIRSSILIESGLRLRELGAEISQCSVFLGNDSGPRHIAAALNCPTVTLFGPEHPFEWHPYPKVKHPYFFIEGLECRKEGLPDYPQWCGLSHCVEEKHQCMKKIGVKEVLAECLRVMKK